MKSKQSWIRHFFGWERTSEKQASRPPVPQTPSDVASPLPEIISPGISVEPSAPIEAAAPLHQIVSSAAIPNRPSDTPVGRVPLVWNIGDVIQNRYEVRGILGEGGMGIVCKVYDRTWSEILAVKSPKPDVFTKAGGKESFMREAQTWVNLEEHPHIVKCDFVQIVDDIPHIFVEYVEGGSLADWMRRRTLYQGGTECALERMLDIAIQCAWGLHAAHEQGLVHQDVKPANVMMTREGIAKVTDFGLAKARVNAGEQAGSEGKEGHRSILVSSRGMTPAYCSPEQAAGRPLSRKTDIWSWGVLVLEMFVGEVTWQNGMLAREVLASYEPQHSAIPPMSPELVKLLARCFAWRPEERPATLLEVATEVQAIYARLGGRSYPRETPAPAKIQAVRRYNQAISLTGLGQLEEALRAFEQTILLDPTYVTAHYNKGHVLNDLERLEEALFAFEQVILLDPTYVMAHTNKGFMLAKLGRPEEALHAFEQAILLNPTNAKAYDNKGTVLNDLGQLEEALQAYEQAILLDPTYVMAHYNKGALLNDLERLEEALSAFEQVILLDPTDAMAHYNKGLMLNDLGRPEEALLAFEQAILLDPTYAKAHNAFAIVLDVLGRPEEALHAYEQAILLDATDADVHYNKGALLNKIGRPEEALLALEQVILLDPMDAMAHNHKGALLEKMGQITKAEQAYQKARELRLES